MLYVSSQFIELCRTTLSGDLSSSGVCYTYTLTVPFNTVIKQFVSECKSVFLTKLMVPSIFAKNCQIQLCFFDKNSWKTLTFCFAKRISAFGKICRIKYIKFHSQI